jgi:hypothetical protein
MSQEEEPNAELYMEFAEGVSAMNDLEMQLYNQKRLMDELKKKLLSPTDDGSFPLELTAHGFKQISERLESLAKEEAIIFTDVFSSVDPQRSLLIPSNLKSFVFTTLAVARKNGQFVKEKSKNNPNKFEYRYTVVIDKWSIEKSLEFVAIVEDNRIKTGFFNWIG